MEKAAGIFFAFHELQNIIGPYLCLIEQILYAKQSKYLRFFLFFLFRGCELFLMLLFD